MKIEMATSTGVFRGKPESIPVVSSQMVNLCCHLGIALILAIMKLYARRVDTIVKQLMLSSVFIDGLQL